MKKAMYVIGQCTWGIAQTFLGLLLFVIHRKSRHYWYHGACITEWGRKTSVSLGLFVFVAAPSFSKRRRGRTGAESYFNRLLVHEYGHTIQSLILGPLYLVVIGIPSVMWCYLAAEKRRREHISYSAFFSESWANRLGEWVTGEKSLDKLVID